MQRLAEKNDLTVGREPLNEPMDVHGVGASPDRCVERLIFPIATQEMDQEAEGTGTLNSFTAPMIPGSP
eukprot:10655845-Lingulodinium_polyedra.AAC.1